MIQFHAVMIDETGCEFGADVRAADREEAYEKLSEDYPESRIAQLESPEDTRRREARIYASVCAEYDDGYDEDDECCAFCGGPTDPSTWECTSGCE